MNTFLRWISPLILAIVILAGIRLVTDISSAYPFWYRSAAVNLTDFLITVVSIYMLDFLFRGLVKSRFRKEKGWQVFGEYVMLTFFLFLGITGSTALAHYFIHYPNYLIDFIISYVVIIPLSLFYYAILRHNEVRKRYIGQALQLERVKSEQLTAELNFLKGQYHPHFLFNALNTVYFQVDEKNETAKRSIELLSDLLRYQLYDIKNEVTIKQEIHFLKSYIDFQRLRINERLKLNVAFDPRLDIQRIHPLLFQPLLENAFKYVGGGYRIDICLALESDKIRFVVENTVNSESHRQTKARGIGIDNLRRRLEILYPGRYTLFAGQQDSVFCAELIIIPDENKLA